MIPLILRTLLVAIGVLMVAAALSAIISTYAEARNEENDIEGKDLITK